MKIYVKRYMEKSKKKHEENILTLVLTVRRIKYLIQATLKLTRSFTVKLQMSMSMSIYIAHYRTAPLIRSMRQILLKQKRLQ